MTISSLYFVSSYHLPLPLLTLKAYLLPRKKLHSWEKFPSDKLLKKGKGKDAHFEFLECLQIFFHLKTIAAQLQPPSLQRVGSTLGNGVPQPSLLNVSIRNTQKLSFLLFYLKFFILLLVLEKVVRFVCVNFATNCCSLSMSFGIPCFPPKPS